MSETSTSTRAAAQDFAAAFLKDTMALVKTFSDETDRDRVEAAVLALREELEAAVRHEHGAEAHAIIAEGYELAQKIHSIAQRYRNGELR